MVDHVATGLAGLGSSLGEQATRGCVDVFVGGDISGGTVTGAVAGDLALVVVKVAAICLA